MTKDIKIDLDKDLRNIGPPITEDLCGLRIDLYLAQNFPFKSRSSWRQLLDKGEVFASKIRVKSSYKLRLNDRISYFYPEHHEPKVEGRIEPIWQHNGILVVSKPPGLAMHEGGAFRKNTFSNQLKEFVGKEWAAIHRLDLETSGAVLCGATPEIRRKLSLQLESKQIQKTYVCLCFNIPSEKEWLLDAPIGNCEGSLVRIKRWINWEGGLPCQTRFKLIETISDDFSMLEAYPLTGRTNQIRIHAAYLGLHLIGDKLYNPQEDLFIKNKDGIDVTPIILHSRVCLHAKKIKFNHPIDNKTYEIEVPLYNDLVLLWNSLKKGSKTLDSVL